ncbi:MAG TPA: response regulator transcription factor [Gemmatimonadaceae bacterium]
MRRPPFMLLLLAEDDDALAQSIAKGLREQGHVVKVVGAGDAAIVEAVVDDYDALILDIMLPGRDGLEVTRTLRARGILTPILILTARDRTDDKVAGLDAGADDYLTKPFEFDELTARLRALLRRGPALTPSVLTIADLVIDTRSRTATRAGQRLPLTVKEYAMLEYLARHAREVVSRVELSAHVWDENHDPTSNALDVYVGRLRRKLHVQGDSGPLIHTRRGAGYILDGASSIDDADMSVTTGEEA